MFSFITFNVQNVATMICSLLITGMQNVWDQQPQEEIQVQKKNGCQFYNCCGAGLFQSLALALAPGVKVIFRLFLKNLFKTPKQAPNSGLKLNVFGSTTLFETVFRIRIRYWQTDLATLDKYLKMDPFSIKLRPCCFQSTIKKKINLHLLNQFTVAVVIKTII